MTTANIDEYRHRPGAAPRAPEARVQEMKGAIQEAVRADALTGDPNWDFFLRYIEAHIKAAQRQATIKRDEAAALVLVDEGRAKVAATTVLALEARATALAEVIALPKWIKENGERAKKAVAELEASL